MNNTSNNNKKYMTVKQPNHKLASRTTWQPNSDAWKNIEESFIGKAR